mmetsp:Transcript_88643/g.248029  ORF Transcript_88643/g.248029 Transcript_88643/m.248029 type:complete len:255 (+) Transcript_88643:54-818(+)
MGTPRCARRSTAGPRAKWWAQVGCVPGASSRFPPPGDQGENTERPRLSTLHATRLSGRRCCHAPAAASASPSSTSPSCWLSRRRLSSAARRLAFNIFKLTRASARTARCFFSVKPAASPSRIASVSSWRHRRLMAFSKRFVVAARRAASALVRPCASKSWSSASAPSTSRESNIASSASCTARRSSSSSLHTIARASCSRARRRATARMPTCRASSSSATSKPALRPNSKAFSISSGSAPSRRTASARDASAER